jgi:phosphoenolpyruvate carboxylase
LGQHLNSSASVEKDLKHIPEFEQRFLRLNAEEPYRLKATAIVHRLAFTRDRHAKGAPHVPSRDYANTAELLADLVLMRDSLLAHRGELIATGLLERTIRTIAAFGIKPCNDGCTRALRCSPQCVEADYRHRWLHRKIT